MNHKGKFAAVVLVLGLVIALLSCRSTQSRNHLQQERSSNLGLPTNAFPSELFSTNSDAVVITVYQPGGDRSAYIYCSHTLKRLVKAKMVSVFRRGTTDSFVVAWVDTDSPKYALVDSQGEMSAPRKLNTNPGSWFSCSASTQHLVCATDRPGLKEDDADFNPLGYTAFLVADLAKNSSQVYGVPSPTSYINFSPSTDLVYTSSELSENVPGNIVTVFDLGGHKRAVHKNWKATNFSSNNRFAVPSLHEGGVDWEAYDTSLWKPRLSIKSSESEGEINWGQWNPVQENLLSVWRRQMSGQNSETDFLEVYDVQAGKKVYSMKVDSNAVYTWSRDGHSVVLIDRGELKSVPIR